MKFHHGLFVLVVIAIPILLGLVVAFEASFRKVAFSRVVLLTLSVVAVGFVVTLPISIKCSESWDVSQAAPDLLTRDELKTLRRTSLICPAVYKFKRNGEDTCLVSDKDGGASIGCG